MTASGFGAVDKLTIPTGTAVSGQVPVATGIGNASAWGFSGPRVFSPLDYGAVGNGTTDDTTAVQAAFAAASAANGTLALGSSTFLTSSPIAIASNIHVTGSGVGTAFLGGIKNATSDLFTVAGTVTSVLFDNCYLLSSTGGGHIFKGTTGNVSTGPVCAFWTFKGVGISQTNAAKGIWYQIGGDFIDCSIESDCNFVAAASASFIPWQILNAPGAVSSVKFSRSRMGFNGGTPTVPFFNFDPGAGAHTDTNVGMTASSFTVTDTSAVAGDLGMFIYHSNFSGGQSLITAVTPGTGYTVQTAATSTLSGQTATIGTRGWYEQVNFEHITFEVCTAGSVYMTGSTDVEIKDCANWDTTATANVYSFTQSLTGYPCSNIRIRGGRGGAVTGGANNFYADTNCYSILLDSFGQGWGVAAVVSSPAPQTTVVNPMGNGVTVPIGTAAGYQSVGTNSAQSWAAGRWVGTTAAGAPTSGAYLTGDWVNSQDGFFYICKASGSPGTWAIAAQPSGLVAPVDAGSIAWTGNPACETGVWQPTSAGVLYVTMFKSGAGGVINSIYYGVNTGGTGLANSFIGIYNSAGTLVAQCTADQSTNLGTGNIYAASLSASYTLAANTTYRVGLVMGSITTGPKIYSLGASNSSLMTNLGAAGATIIQGTTGSGLTALPGSFTPSGLATAVGYPVYVMK